MTKIKFCGLSRDEDIAAANELNPDYIGFVFAPKSRRHVTLEKARELKHRLQPGIQAVGVFVNQDIRLISALAAEGIIDMIQLHGQEDEDYLRKLKSLTDRPILQAFLIKSPADIPPAQKSPADFILLDAGAGTGTSFDWSFIGAMTRPYFLAGGLTAENVPDAIRRLNPYAVDTSSGIESRGKKDRKKMADFAAAVRKEARNASALPDIGKEHRP